jgi:group II intron reverse transcriptase/maturase
MMDTNVDGKVQRVQAMLYAKTSNEPEVRFKRLYKYLTRPEWVEAAIDKILRNRGSRTAGIDGKTRRDYQDENERVELAKSILDELGTQTYHPQPVRRVYIPKPNGKKRPLGIATIKDRVVQQMVKMLIEPIFEAVFLPCSYGFRPNRCTWDALAEARRFLLSNCQYYTVIFGAIDHGTLMRQLRRRILDKRLLALIWKMLRAGVMEGLQYAETTEGAPQGGPLSPLLANVYMHRLDEWMHQRFHAMTTAQRYVRRRKGELVSARYSRFADDFIVLMRDGERAEELKRELADFIHRELKMTLSEEKTTIVHARQGFDFLGVRTFLAPRRSNPHQELPYQVPSKKSVKAYRQKVKELTDRSLDYLPPGDRIRALNWLVEGWANYHHWGNAKETFADLGSWTIKKVHTMLHRYTPRGKARTYGMYFRPIAECANLRQWSRYTNWRTPSVKVDKDIQLGLLPMGVISTGEYWQYRGKKIPPAYRVLDDEAKWNERETDFYTDVEIIQGVIAGHPTRENTDKYSPAYFHKRKAVFQRDKYTCTACGYKSQRRKGDIHDVEVHHVNPEGGYGIGNLRTVCLPCHRRHEAIQQAD